MGCGAGSSRVGTSGYECGRMRRLGYGPGPILVQIPPNWNADRNGSGPLTPMAWRHPAHPPYLARETAAYADARDDIQTETE